MYALFASPAVVQPLGMRPSVADPLPAPGAAVRPIYELFTWKSLNLLPPRAEAEDFHAGGRRFPSPPSSASDHISEEESVSDGEEKVNLSLSFDIPPEGAGEVYRPGGKYSCEASTRCQHKEHWDRLRGKRGYSYFECRKCGACWRQPTKNKLQAKA